VRQSCLAVTSNLSIWSLSHQRRIRSIHEWEELHLDASDTFINDPDRDDPAMVVCVPIEFRFSRLPDGSVWTPNQYSLSFWRRYLDVFDHVRCLARVKEVRHVERGGHRVDGPGVSFCRVPHYIGPAQFLTRAWQVRDAVRRSIYPGDAFVLRVPGTIGTLAWGKLMAMQYPYGVEVTGDPYEVFSPGAVRHPLRGFFRWHTTRQLRLQCARASAASYVTAQALQQRYPSRGPAISASSIELRDDALALRPRAWAAGSRARNLIFVGSLEQYYKGPDLLIRAVADSVVRGVDLRLTIVGDGRIRPALDALVRELHCEDRVRFAGQRASAEVAELLDAADVFVLPSRTEGLPRAMIEAMARGLPCLGSDAGGIPELLARDAIVARGDAVALADKICEVIGDPERMTRMAADNFDNAKVFRTAMLQQKRIGFYRRVRTVTEAWLRDHAS
jgi:glycosyltransferase involved in cell wall biosynthesis